MLFISRRRLIAAGAAATAPALFAQTPSEGTVRLVVPFGAGTTTDIVSRVVGEGLAKALQQTGLRTASAAVLASPEVANKLREQGIEQRVLRAEELAAFNRVEIDKWAQLVKRSGAQVD